MAGNGAAQFAPSFPVGGGPQAPGTEFATGNNPASLPAFTSETIIGGPFGRNSAAAFPMTHSSTIVSYATAGVSAGVTAPATGSLVGGPQRCEDRAYKLPCSNFPAAAPASNRCKSKARRMPAD